MIFENWDGVIRILVVGLLTYLWVILLLRVSGKRTLAKWNAFDFVVTVALGSSLATVILSKQVPFIEGVLALLLLIGLQFAITWFAVRSSAVENIAKAEPKLLLSEGRFLDEALTGERVTRSEVRAAIRSSGLGSLDDVAAVVLETDGSISVVNQTNRGNGSALSDVSGYKENG